jgi:hypothetical protein
MNFLSPSAFYFLLAIPVVVLFYLLKRKRVVRLVGSTLLWQKFLAETQANAPFQKLKHNSVTPPDPVAAFGNPRLGAPILFRQNCRWPLTRNHP